MGVARGLRELPDEYFLSLAREYAVRRDRICSALADAGLTPFVPKGAYYVLADISGLPGGSSKERAMFLLHRAGVACVPGEAFFHDYAAGDNLARFCFAKQDADLDEACVRLRAFGRSYLSRAAS
jgi:aminotransferase